MNEEVKKPRGFAALTPEQRTEIAKKGGRSVPSDKRSFSQDRDLARSAGSLGGSRTYKNKRKLTPVKDTQA